MENTKVNWPYYKEVLAEQSALFSDQYALTMSQALFANGQHDINTTFHGFIRKEPFGGSFLLTAGQSIILEWLKDHWTFDEVDLEILRNKKIADPKTGEMKPLYTEEFIEMLANSELELTVDAMPEGEIAFADEPIVRVNGPVWQCLMVEAGILNIINSQSLFATLASRICQATEGAPVLEFGLRRAQTIGGLEPTRASFIGGVKGTSNNLAEKYYGIPSSGTMAHALVMMYEDELDAFKNYAKAMPYNGIFLVDTYDTLEGVKNAIDVCKDNDLTLKGIRLDSGDMAQLSIDARDLLDEAGFEQAKIAASNDLEENSIRELKERGAKIDLWGIGTNLVTSRAQPALGAVYKLGAVFDFDQELSPEALYALRDGAQNGTVDPEELAKMTRNVIKLSGDAIKVSIPGELDVIRTMEKDEISGEMKFNGDIIVSNMQDSPVDADGRLKANLISSDKNDDLIETVNTAGTLAYHPLQRFIDKGTFVREIGTVHDARERAEQTLARFRTEHKDLTNPTPYNVTLSQDLYGRRQAKIAEASLAVA